MVKTNCFKAKADKDGKKRNHVPHLLLEILVGAFAQKREHLVRATIPRSVQQLVASKTVQIALNDGESDYKISIANKNTTHM
jgi:hypothetical protein